MSTKKNALQPFGRALRALEIMILVGLVAGLFALAAHVRQEFQRRQEVVASVQAKASELGLQVRTECEDTLLGAKCKYFEDPLPVNEVTRVIASMPQCEGTAMLSKVHAKGAVNVLDVLDAEASCR